MLTTTAGIVPAIILIFFLGVFALYTAKLLIDFKLNHPEVHNMGKLGFQIVPRLLSSYRIFAHWQVMQDISCSGLQLARSCRLVQSPLLFSVLYAVLIVSHLAVLNGREYQGSELLSGQQALTTLSNQGLCSTYLVLICAAVALVISLPRTLDQLTWMSLLSVVVITLSGVVAMIGAGANPVPGRVLSVTLPSNFYDAFLAVTNPVCPVLTTVAYFSGVFLRFLLTQVSVDPKLVQVS